MNRFEFEDRYSYEFIGNTSDAYLFDNYIKESYNRYQKPYVATVKLTIVDKNFVIVSYNKVTYTKCAELTKAISANNSLLYFHVSTYYPIQTPLEELEYKIIYYLTKKIGFTQCKTTKVSENSIINRRTFYLVGPWTNSELLTYIRIRYDGLLADDQSAGENMTTGVVIIDMGKGKSFSVDFDGIEEAIAGIQNLLELKFLGVMSKLQQVLLRFEKTFENNNNISGNDFSDVVNPVSFIANRTLVGQLKQLTDNLTNYDVLHPSE